MDREISEAVMLGVKLIAVSIVIGLVLMQVTFGNQIKDGALVQVADVQQTLDTGTLDSISGATGQIVPLSSIYEIVYREYTGIEKFELDGEIYEQKTFENKDGDTVTRWVSNVNTDDKIDNEEYWNYLSDLVEDKGLTGRAIMRVERDDKSRMYIMKVARIDD